VTPYPHALAPCYTARMTPIIEAAWNRKPRRNPRAIQRARGEGGTVPEAHNYLAQDPKKKPGAPHGNRNAARRSLEDVERVAALDVLIHRLSADADAAIAMVDRFCAERAALAALLRGAQ
jgi:hypothetical protein